jgi:N-acetylneuraminic acid mutarotase
VRGLYPVKDAIILSSSLGRFVSANKWAATVSLCRLLRSGLLILLVCLPLAAFAQMGEWTWMGGSNKELPRGYGAAGVSGSLGAFATKNIPGTRWGAASATDKNGDLWLFGGEGYDVVGNYGNLNDLWEFSSAANQWAWMGGRSTVPRDVFGYPGVYGTLGLPASANIPGGRGWMTSCGDSSGRLWLFGGLGEDAAGSEGGLNDLWVFDPSTNQWTWLSGSSTVPSSGGNAGVYGIAGEPAPGNSPGGRTSASSWIGNDGHFWLFGGYGLDANGTLGLLNDLWEFDPSTLQWTWMAGGNVIGSLGGLPGTPGLLGVFAPGVSPGGRLTSANWTDANGHLWLFGGNGYDAHWKYSNLNDLWQFDPSRNEWAWMGGSPTSSLTPGGYPAQPGIYGTLGVPAPANIPGSRSSASGWTDPSGHLWLFGGVGFAADAKLGYLNDLWEFDPATNEWAWMSGSSIIGNHCNDVPSCGQPGVFGILGVPAPGNVPGGVSPAASWSDNWGQFWFFGGEDYNMEMQFGDLNVFWRYLPPGVLPPVSRPTFSVASGSYTAPQTVGIANFTGTATSHYTLDGSIPTADSTKYLGPIKIAKTTTINAIATAPGYANSAVASATYTINLPTAATPTLSVAAGTYTSTQSVSIADKTTGATIYYTLDGSTPTTGSAKYSSALKVGQTTTINAIAVATGYLNSDVASATYTINLPAATPTFSPKAGTYSSIQTVAISDANANSTIFYTTDGSTPSAKSAVYSTPLTVSKTATIKAIATAPGSSTSAVASATYTINLTAVVPAFTPPAGTYGAAQSVALATTTPNATIYYTTNGSAPTTASMKYTGPLTVKASETVKAIAAASGYANSPVASAAYLIVGAPTVTTGKATSIATPKATLNATVNTLGAAGQAWFAWGTSATALSNTTAATTLPASTGTQSTSATLTGLAGKTTYYFQAVASTVGGTTSGTVQNFKTN